MPLMIPLGTRGCGQALIYYTTDNEKESMEEKGH